ncbi:dihydrofolate reductase family protein [Pannonibacter phragmitetus]|uniref:dihydrofolate reductase family protein n=1 Tax=Pannonibacter phragmitetus TaxID=121719 RepID=UPI000ADF8529|nr:dihydrofolate reductase family protein [Pannonibacter phragmitetus]
MRKLIAWNLMSLDGHFQGSRPWDLDFHQSVWGDELEAISLDQLADMDMLLFGRKTYDGMKDHWERASGAIAEAMNGMPKRVASRRVEETTWRNAAVMDTDVVSFVRREKATAGKNIYVFGSADLLDTLLMHGLVDECRICLAPLTLGRGSPLFKSGRGQNLKLLEARTLKTGGIFARYDARPDRVDSALRLVEAPADAVYAALVDPEAMVLWRAPDGMAAEVLELDRREGGRFRMALRYDNPDQPGKSGDGSDIFESRFVRLDPHREVTEAIAFQSDDPAYSGTMMMTTHLRPVGDATEVSIIARDVPEGIAQEDHLVGLSSTLAKLEEFLLQRPS